MARLRIEGLKAPVVEDQQLDAAERPQHARIATVAEAMTSPNALAMP
jgi:hypothetical protein